MSVVKVKIQKDFTVLYNGVLENPNISYKAKGLWAYCMSRPDNWQFHVDHLATVSKEGKDAIYSALKELESAGLVEKHQSNERGVFGAVDYIVYPYPKEIQKILPLRGFPETEEPETENPPLTSTDVLPSIETKVVCIDPPVGGQSQPSVLVKLGMDGKEISVSLSDVFTQAVLGRKDWSTEEINEAWKILGGYKGFIREPLAYLEGTIGNLRKKKKMEYLNKNKKSGEEKCKKTEMKESNTCNQNSLADDSQGRPSLQSLLEKAGML